MNLLQVRANLDEDKTVREIMKNLKCKYPIYDAYKAIYKHTVNIQ